MDMIRGRIVVNMDIGGSPLTADQKIGLAEAMTSLGYSAETREAWRARLADPDPLTGASPALTKVLKAVEGMLTPSQVQILKDTERERSRLPSDGRPR